MSELIERVRCEIQKGAVTGFSVLQNHTPQLFTLSDASAREIAVVALSAISESIETAADRVARVIFRLNDNAVPDANELFIAMEAIKAMIAMALK